MMRPRRPVQLRNSLSVIIFLSSLFGCITEYEPTGMIEEQSDILVVDGIITDHESVITLSLSRSLTDETPDMNYIYDATVYVELEDDDLIRFPAGQPNYDLGYPRYIINNGELVPNRRYRLVIAIDYVSEVCNSYFSPSLGHNVTYCQSRTTTHIYYSDFSYPIITPEIDSVFWMKNDTGQPVTIHVATHASDDQDMYYHWSYREDWEIRPFIPKEDIPNVCWNFSYNSDILLASTARTISGRVTNTLAELPPSDRKLSLLYRIDVTQNAISKQAYEYFSNKKKLAGQIGSIFAPIPSETKGNINCVTDTRRLAIGYVEVSTSAQKRMYISHRDNVYEMPDILYCGPFTTMTYCELTFLMGRHQFSCGPDTFRDIESLGYVVYRDIGISILTLYVLPWCVDCDGTIQKPDDWEMPPSD